MTIVAANLLEPHGEIPADLFGSETERNARTWLNRAQAHATAAGVTAALLDAAATAYAYHLAFAAKARQLAALPASYSEDGASMSHSTQQASFFQKLADGHLARFDGYVAAASSAPPPPAGPRSGSVPTVVVF